MSLHLDAHEDCYSSAPAVKRDRHWVIRIDSAKDLDKASSEFATDEFYEENDQLFLKYFICDDVELQQPLLVGKKIHILK